MNRTFGQCKAVVNAQQCKRTCGYGPYARYCLQHGKMEDKREATRMERERDPKRLAGFRSDEII